MSIKCAALTVLTAAACHFSFAGYNDLGPYSNDEYNDFWDLRGHSEVDVSSESATCSSATFDPGAFDRACADGCDVNFTRPGYCIILR